MLRRILVLLDASLVGRRIVPWVRRLLAPVGGDVHLLVVLAPGWTVMAGSRTGGYASQSEGAAPAAATVGLGGGGARPPDAGVAGGAGGRVGRPGAGARAPGRAW